MKHEQFTKALKSEWLEALRSGKYSKGTGKLKTRKSNDKLVDMTTAELPREEANYCCIGVLGEICDVAFNPNGLSFDAIPLDNNKMYSVMLNIINEEQIEQLVILNDEDPDDDFEAVIEYIEQLPTID